MRRPRLRMTRSRGRWLFARSMGRSWITTRYRWRLRSMRLRNGRLNVGRWRRRRGRGGRGILRARGRRLRSWSGIASTRCSRLWMRCWDHSSPLSSGALNLQTPPRFSPWTSTCTLPRRRRRSSSSQTTTRSSRGWRRRCYHRSSRPSSSPSSLIHCPRSPL